MGIRLDFKIRNGARRKEHSPALTTVQSISDLEGFPGRNRMRRVRPVYTIQILLDLLQL
ncbi:MAG: hypothetical protein PWR31_2046 [Bacillota bacterium]|nr:hypothetical protein [Bacillota bacterium]